MRLNDSKRWFFLTISVQIKESGLRNSWFFLLVEFRIRDFFACAIRNPGLQLEFSSGIRKPTTDWNPKSKFHWQRIGMHDLESGIHGVEFRIQDFLGFPFIGRTMFVTYLLPFHLPFHIIGTMVWIRAWWLWNGIKFSFDQDYVVVVAPFVQFSYIMPDVDEPWWSWKMNWQVLVSKPCTVWPYTGTITLLSLPKGLFGDHLQRRHKDKLTIIITIFLRYKHHKN